MTAFGAKCPHCDTLFKVYPDQLRLHNGYANCGACGLSFDVQTALLLLPPHQTQFLPSQPDRRTDYPYSMRWHKSMQPRSPLMRPSGKMMQAREHTK